MQSRYKEFSYAWRIVLASALGIGLGLAPIPVYTLGIFAGPISAEFGWGIDKIFLALIITTLCSLVFGPAVGALIDRIGVRKVAIGSVIGFGVGMMLHALNQGSFTQYLLTWGIVAFLGIGTLPITWTRVINNWFSDCRGLALGCALLTTGVVGFLITHYVNYFIEHFGWRWAFVGVGILPLLISLPVVCLLFRDVDDPAIEDKHKPHFATQHGSMAQVPGFTAKETFSDWRFWLMSVCFVAISFGVGGIFPNMKNLFETKGFDTNTAVELYSYMAISVIVGRLAGGFLIDRVWAPIVATVLLMLPALSCYFLMQGELTYAVAAFSAFLIGLAAGAEQDLMAFLVARYFGMKRYGLIYGLIYGCFAVGAGFAPSILGGVYEKTGTYDEVLGYVGIAFVAGALPLLLLGKYRDFHAVKE